MWFTIATHVTEYYSQKVEEPEDAADGEPVTPPTKRGRVQRAFRSSGKKKSMKADPLEEDDLLEFISSNEVNVTGAVKHSPSITHRRQAVTVSHSQLQLGECNTPTKSIPEDPKDQPLPQLYRLFQLCVQVRRGNGRVGFVGVVVS